MAWPQPGRLHLEAPAALSIAALMAELGRVATDAHIAPMSETLSSPLTGTASVSFARPDAECFGAVAGGPDML